MAVNRSVGIGVLPFAWRTAIITSVPKCTPVDEINDLRPISVTPILSRLVERLTVRDHIVSLISSDDVIDQYMVLNQRALLLQNLLIKLTEYLLC